MADSAVFLDTLAQLRKSGYPPPLTPLQKRARAKYATQPLVIQLAELKTPLEKSYRNTFYCTDTVVRRGNKVTTRYCGNRWCLTCNRIRTGKLINGYQATLESLPDLQFVTLTAPNVKAESLGAEIDRILKVCRLVNDTLRKKKVLTVGIRKLEVTYNVKEDTYHPHLHFLISGKDSAQALLNEWLKRNPSSNRGAQSIVPADKKTVHELFKYFTKLTADSGKIKPHSLDVIFSAMAGKRVFQPVGNLHKVEVSEELEALDSKRYLELSNNESGYYEWSGEDWYNLETGEALTNYSPSDAIRAYIEKIGIT
jgi:hypothetical protein